MRQIVGKLLADRLTFEPEGKGLRFRATGTVERLIEGAVPGVIRPVLSPTGKNLCKFLWTGGFRPTGHVRPDGPAEAVTQGIGVAPDSLADPGW